MRGLGALWRWWTESWGSTRRARWTYIAMTTGFGGLAVAGALAGDAAVAAIAAGAALLTAALAAIAPRLGRWASGESDIRYNGGKGESR